MKKLIMGLTLLASISSFASDCSNKDVKFLTISRSHIGLLDQLKSSLRDRGVYTENLTVKEDGYKKMVTFENLNIEEGVIVSLDVEEDRIRRAINGGAYEYITTALWASLIPEEPFYRTNFRLRVGLTGINTFIAGHNIDTAEVKEEVADLFNKIELRCRD